MSADKMDFAVHELIQHAGTYFHAAKSTRKWLEHNNKQYFDVKQPSNFGTKQRM